MRLQEPLGSSLARTRAALSGSSTIRTLDAPAPRAEIVKAAPEATPRDCGVVSIGKAAQAQPVVGRAAEAEEAIRGMDPQVRRASRDELVK